MYHQSAVPMLQQLVDNWIMTTEGGAFAAPPVVHLTDFPNPTYTEDGFWSAVSQSRPAGVSLLLEKRILSRPNEKWSIVRQ